MNRVLKVNKVKCLEKRNREKSLKLKELKEKTFKNFRDLVCLVKENKNLKKEVKELLIQETKDKINSQNLLFTKELEIDNLEKNNKKLIIENKELFKKTNELAESLAKEFSAKEEKEKFYKNVTDFYKKEITTKEVKIEGIKTNFKVLLIVECFITFILLLFKFSN